MLGKMISIVSTAFVGDKDKGGTDYVMHCLHVMYGVEYLGKEAMIAAVGHDLLEDKPKIWNGEKLITAGFLPSTVAIIELLTHAKGEDYMTYIRRLSVSPIARAIKMADLRHNSEIHRMHNKDGLTEKDKARLDKYYTAYAFLKGIAA